MNMSVSERQQIIRNYLAGGGNRWCDISQGHTDFVLYSTRIVRLNACGNSVTLDTGGHRTTTTSRAINHALEAIGSRMRVYRSESTGWHVMGTARAVRTDTPFIDGMTLILR